MVERAVFDKKLQKSPCQIFSPPYNAASPTRRAASNAELPIQTGTAKALKLSLNKRLTR
ncbi:Uncharacterised protein [Grimontia hollisae]|uniref:Uncharacterized protein n=1 Tax=Grimontia hollisae TaxID=673 RepID=A0A377HS40_GRIHO|nr:Uncharacterised protein [Grimontia hollisae]STQ77943.1 Uncharacterised protein [Grimontia hollisae]